MLGGGRKTKIAYDWGRRFRSTFSLDTCDAAEAAIGLSAGCASLGPGAFLALQELLSQSVLKAVVATGTDQSAFKMAIRNSHPEVAYKNPQFVLKREGHCEAHHMEAKVPGESEEHVFVHVFLTIRTFSRELSETNETHRRRTRNLSMSARHVLFGGRMLW